MQNAILIPQILPAASQSQAIDNLPAPEDFPVALMWDSPQGAGKAVIICDTPEQAIEAINALWPKFLGWKFCSFRVLHFQQVICC
ncbi:MAG: hypothetical protein A2664_04100 [Candidatus Taylorbacteria bacterium RIFCSPHIGHO2_01_FULL_46_22b]|uniref:Uncharacterized protein n=1 Tax=Candidatus Taylorbacteria bacterium RIFCSPHIGHO2_01_FULL_46_22b TaxID=1802301 RepID=A0A1G2M1R9_9BACT|nr:MAG: hypothetical protein A2664_04100 [Candidatus Taylorbacteria bacterium RIFCSPHIGHO2_01_FULL_46_22b]